MVFFIYVKGYGRGCGSVEWGVACQKMSGEEEKGNLVNFFF